MEIMWSENGPWTLKPKVHYAMSLVVEGKKDKNAHGPFHLMEWTLKFLVSIRSKLEMGESFVSFIKKDKQMVPNYDIFRVEWSSSNWMILSKISHNGVTHKRCNVQVSILLGHGDVIQNRGKERTQIHSPTFYCGTKKKRTSPYNLPSSSGKKGAKGSGFLHSFCFLKWSPNQKKRFQGLKALTSKWEVKSTLGTMQVERNACLVSVLVCRHIPPCLPLCYRLSLSYVS